VFLLIHIIICYGYNSHVEHFALWDTAFQARCAAMQNILAKVNE